MEAIGYLTTFTIVLVFSVWGLILLTSLWVSRKKPQPKLAGTLIPELGEGIDVSKRYDITYSGGDRRSQFVESLQAIKIIGYVGKDDDETMGKMYMRSRWLVVEFPDGRRAYLMPDAIVSLQESVVP